jgi:hypothetical protein
MAWMLYTAIYELHNPLHVGYHKVGNLQRTRYYIPARNLWGAVTEALTRRGFHTQNAPLGDYRAIGEWVKAHCAFGYWFVYENQRFLTPGYSKDGLKYGDLTVAEFERRYLDTYASTAIDPATTSAEEGSLHEVEFIAPYHPVRPDHQGAALSTRIAGRVFLDETALPMLGEESRWRAWLDDLQIGGERRYGFGMLRLVEMKQMNDSQTDLTGKRPRQSVPKDAPLLAHTAVAPGIQVRGQIEPLVGRETSQSDAFGSYLSPGMICWIPGSVPMEDVQVQFEPEGYWRVIG